MPIVIKKHFGDSDNDNDLDSFLEEPAEKKRKLNNEKSQASVINQSAKNEKNKKNKKSKSMLKRLRIKKKRQKNIINNQMKPINKNNRQNTNSIILFESIKPNQIAISFQTLFLKTLKTTTKQLGFKFKPSHFIEIISKDIDPIHNNTQIGSLDILQHFLRNYFNNTINENEDNFKNIDRRKEINEWIAYTKSMQVMIISPSVRKAVDTIKALENINVKHSFIHQKILSKMSMEEYEEYEENKEEQMSIIGLRVCELFGKHRKIEYQEKELLNKSWHCGVGGINRINKLCKSKHLTLKKCQLIIIDLQRNVKNMSILDMHQICKELCQWLQQYAFIRIKNKHTKIAFF